MIELELLIFMIVNTKTARDPIDVEKIDAFFLNNPTPQVRDLMRDTVVSFIS